MTAKQETAGANIYAKIANIQQDIHTVIKGGYNDHFKYAFARERDVVAEVKPLLGREGIAVTHTLLSEQEIPHGTTSSGSPKYLTKLTFRFRLTNVKDKDDFVEADAIGSGQDGEDKGVPKAYTMALKYFLSKMFLIETGDDSEQERGTGAKGKRNAPPKAEEGAEEKFEKAKRMIRDSRNVDGLLEYQENLATAKKSSFNATQKKELLSAVKARISALEAGGEVK